MSYLINAVIPHLFSHHSYFVHSFHLIHHIHSIPFTTFTTFILFHPFQFISFLLSHPIYPTSHPNNHTCNDISPSTITDSVSSTVRIDRRYNPRYGMAGGAALDHASRYALWSSSMSKRCANVSYFCLLRLFSRSHVLVRRETLVFWRPAMMA